MDRKREGRLRPGRGRHPPLGAVSLVGLSARPLAGTPAGQTFWVELDRGDFGLLQRKFIENTLLLDRILDRLKAGQENLDIICWAHTWGIPIDPVLQILEALDINSRRLGRTASTRSC